MWETLPPLAARWFGLLDQFVDNKSINSIIHVLPLWQKGRARHDQRMYVHTYIHIVQLQCSLQQWRLAAEIDEGVCTVLAGIAAPAVPCRGFVDMTYDVSHG